MPIDTFTATIERVCRVLRTMSTQLDEAGLAQQARLLEHASVALTSELRLLLASPDDATPPEGTYLDRLSQDLHRPHSPFPTPDLARYLVQALLEARSLLHRAQPALEISGDADLVTELQAFLSRLDLGPGHVEPDLEPPPRRRTGG